jgi:hypothetical protein
MSAPDLMRALYTFAGCSVAAAVACATADTATLMGSALEAPPQHELDMIDLHI